MRNYWRGSATIFVLRARNKRQRQDRAGPNRALQQTAGNRVSVVDSNERAVADGS
jgi:hypothetical protein